jgi:RNA polymerase sigma-70 factor (ECF subfamily)
VSEIGSRPQVEVNAAAGVDADPAAPDLLRLAIDRHAAVVYRLALSIVRDPALADDVVQETMIKAWRAAPVDAD